MKKIYFFVVLIVISTVIACSSGPEQSKTTDKDNDSATTSKQAPDNTGRNERDQSGQKLTPPDQLEQASDLDITQKIRQSIVADDLLSMNAKNVKIITENGFVTLRGVVNSTAEKNEVARLAKQVTGVKDIDNQLEVTEVKESK